MGQLIKKSLISAEPEGSVHRGLPQDRVLSHLKPVYDLIFILILISQLRRDLTCYIQVFPSYFLTNPCIIAH